jgi:hypothetical protein
MLVESMMIRDVITCHPLDFVEDASALDKASEV